MPDQAISADALKTDPGGATYVPAIDGSNNVRLNAAGVASWIGAGKVERNIQTGTAYTLVLADTGKMVEMTNASANTVTIPANASVAFPTDTVIEVRRGGAGTTTIVAAGGVTLRTPGTAEARVQWSSMALHKRDTNEWVVSGDTT